MAIAGSLYKLVFGGSLAVSETWSVSFHVLGTAGGIEPISVLLQDAVTQWLARPESKISQGAVLQYIKYNQIDPVTLDYSSPTESNTFFFETPPFGANAIGAPHLTVCVSTVTDASRGLASKGRFFPPTGGLDIYLGGDGRLQAGTAMAMAVSAAQMVTDINGAVDGSCVVFSKTGQTTREIVGTRVGRVIDTQQRRRKNLIEDHQSAPIS